MEERETRKGGNERGMGGDERERDERKGRKQGGGREGRKRREGNRGKERREGEKERSGKSWEKREKVRERAHGGGGRGG